MKTIEKNTSILAIVKFIGLAIGLSLCGALFAVIGGLIGGRVIGENNFGSLGLAVLGTVAGYFLGNLLGMVLIKKFILRHSSILLGILGSITGVVITIAVGIILDPNINLSFWLALIGVPVFCLAGFYLKK